MLTAACLLLTGCTSTTMPAKGVGHTKHVAPPTVPGLSTPSPTVTAVCVYLAQHGTLQLAMDSAPSGNLSTANYGQLGAALSVAPADLLGPLTHLNSDLGSRDFALVLSDAKQIVAQCRTHGVTVPLAF